MARNDYNSLPDFRGIKEKNLKDFLGNLLNIRFVYQ